MRALWLAWLAVGANAEPGALVVSALDPRCAAPAASAPSAPAAPAAQAAPPQTARRALPGTSRVSADAAGRVTVSSEGAPAATVLRAIADASGTALVIRGARGNEPVFTALDAVEASDAIGAIALSVGLVAIPTGKNTLLVVDVADSDAALRQRAALREKPLGTTVRVVPTRHAPFSAEVLARLALGCRGRALPLPADGLVLLEDIRDALDGAESIVRAVETRAARALVPVEPRRPVIAHDLPACSTNAAHVLDATTTAALVALARASKPAAVVGCVPDLALTRATPGLSAVALAGLAPFQLTDDSADAQAPFSRPARIGVLTSEALVGAYAARAQRPATGPRVLVRSIAHAREAAAAADFILGRGVALGDDGAGVVVVRVHSDDELDQVERLFAVLDDAARTPVRAP